MKKNRQNQTAVDRTGRFLMAQENFLADGVLWVRCTYTRKIFKVRYSGKSYIIYEPESVYMPEIEWINKSRK